MPEVAREVGDLAKFDYPTEIFRKNYDPGLDDLHLPLMDEYLFRSVRSVLDVKPELKDFAAALPSAYYTNGSSEGIYHLLARHKTHFPDVPLFQFEGEYQGYGEYARALGMEFYTVPHGTDPRVLRPGVFFISAPSAVDGNIADNSLIEHICETGHYVVLDLAYAGMAQYAEHQKIQLHDHVAAVVGSMSKPFGLYYHRIGFLWAKDPVDSLYGNRWFKNAFSIEVGKAVIDQYTAADLAEKYRPWQSRACKDASDWLGYQITPSDVWLLGHAFPNPKYPMPLAIEPFKRGPGYRFCLTPYYMAYEREA